MGIFDEIKSIFQEKTIAGLGYATVSGLAAGTLDALLKMWAGNNKYAKYIGYIGDILGAGVMAYVADKYLGHPEWKGYAIFGGLFPPVWEWVKTSVYNPEEAAKKVGASLGLTWHQAAASAYGQPVTVTVAPVKSVEPVPTPAQEEFLY